MIVSDIYCAVSVFVVGKSAAEQQKMFNPTSELLLWLGVSYELGQTDTTHALDPVPTLKAFVHLTTNHRYD